MIRKPGGISVFDQAFEACEMPPVEFVGRAEIDRHSVLDDSVLFENRVKLVLTLSLKSWLQASREAEAREPEPHARVNRSIWSG